MADDRNVLALRTVATLAAGTLGGYVALRLSLPLPWMVGSLFTVAALGILRVRIAGHGPMVPRPLRNVVVPVIGVMLGASFTPDVAERMGRWWITMLALTVFIGGSTAIVYQIYRRIFRFDPVTAYFSAVPGGLIEMSTMGDAAGGKAATISLIHFCRIVLSALSVPFIIALLHGPVGDFGELDLNGGHAPMGPLDAAILVACGIGGFLAARAVRLPGAAVAGPMIASAVVHATGLTAAGPPAILVIVAQIVLGGALGSGFSDLSRRDLARALRAAACAIGVMLCLTVSLAHAMHGMVGEPLGALILAYAPGGVAEMSLIALAAEISVAFVAAHHIGRIFLSVLIMPLVFRATVGRTDGAP